MPGSGSFAFGSPIRLEAGRAKGEYAAVYGTLEVEILQPGVEDTIIKERPRRIDGTVETAVRSRAKKRPREDG